MSRNVLRALKIPARLFGDPELACKQVLHPLSEVASAVVFVLPQLDFKVLARLTCGMAPFMRRDTVVTVLFLVSEENQGSIVDKTLEATELEALGAKGIRHQLSYFKFFVEFGAIR